MNLLTIDCETTMNGNDDIGLAHPMCEANYVVLPGCRYASVNKIGSIVVYPEVDFVVGHNLSFDLMYLYRNVSLKEYLQKQRLWDTQLAEYILSSQLTKFSSLDQLCFKYGLPLKDDKIKKYFEAGIGSDKIPLDELTPYLERDLENTEAIAQFQIETAIETGQLDLIISQMEALQATTEMMFNGLAIDQDAFDMHSLEISYEHSACTASVASMGRHYPLFYPADFGSPKQWSTFFFGGKRKDKRKDAVGLFKNGNIKYKTVEFDIPILGASTVHVENEWKSEKTGAISVDDTVLKVISNKDKDPDIKYLAIELLRQRDLNKQLTTYIQGLSKHIQKGKIHGNLNHTATITGRLSSTKPNLQNISNDPIKKIFVSRWGSEGRLVEADFSQLEVVALAHIARDLQLCKDISSGVDIHSELYKNMYGRYPTKEERKPFKSLTFGLIYGAGVKTLATNAGIDMVDSKRFIDTFYTRYPSVKKWHEGFYEKAEALGEHLTVSGATEIPRTFKYRSETSRCFLFKEYYNKSSWSTRDYTFSPTELKNYPVQGLATGDIVPMMLGVLFRKFINRDDVLLINTIHDSVMFDVKTKSVDLFVKEVRDELGKTHQYYKATFGKPLALKLNAGVSVGLNWYDMKEI